MDMRSLNHQASLREWRELISECRNSGKSVRNWCEENSVSPSKYYYWLRAIRNESLVLARKSLAVPAQQFAQVLVKEDEQDISASSGTCAILKSGPFSLEIHNGADLKVLEHTLRIIGNLC
ncbi:IS66 family insertion sequence element accessory protein TnpA [Gudongella oleilytica]|uniref:IS66 family insertion sequence element accessory protein TnpA n=1 Tax=Gudongella oleilytica TaxID=1582259 RepID=UPI000FF88479|nr:hypothetical protein [Gudongella oleilytica]